MDRSYEEGPSLSGPEVDDEMRYHQKINAAGTKFSQSKEYVDRKSREIKAPQYGQDDPRDGGIDYNDESDYVYPQASHHSRHMQPHNGAPSDSNDEYYQQYGDR